jgi:hypothetical protein
MTENQKKKRLQGLHVDHGPQIGPPWRYTSTCKIQRLIDYNGNYKTV